MPRFLVPGHDAVTTPEFNLNDIPGTSGRLDVLCRCVRAGLLVSHGLRQDAEVWLVLLGGKDAPKAVRFRGGRAKRLNPDERTTASHIKAALRLAPTGPVWRRSTPGVELAALDFEAALDAAGGPLFVLDEAGADVRDVALPREATFVIGDHVGITSAERAALDARGATPIKVGPVSLHADDAVTLVWNELDRRAA